MTMNPIAVTTPVVILAAADARTIADTIFAAADLAGRHGQRLNPRILTLAAALHSATGTTEPAPMPADEYLDHEQIDSTTAAEILGCSDRNVRALAARGRLPGVKNGGKWWFNRDDVEVFVNHRD